MITLKLPPRFIRDCQECDCDIGDYDYKRGLLTATPTQIAELKNRAAYYADTNGPDLAPVGLKAAAKALIKALDRPS
jgi:hypothetical protein